MHKEIGNNFKQIRKSLGKTQSDFAEVLGVTFQQVQKYDNGSNRLTLANAIKICNHYHVRLGTITNGLLNGAKDVELFMPDERSLVEAYREMSEDKQKAIYNLVVGE
jgi:transcriptional regulator with XRE-family HTH domain